MTVLLVAATGGHLAQLDRLANRIPGVDSDAVWVTFESPQSQSLLCDRPHVFVPYIGPRDLRRAVRCMPLAGKVIRDVKPSLVVSTGNAIAVSFLPVARSMRVTSAYIESAARTDGPSLTGRIVRCVPGVRLFSQYRGWARPPWIYVGSVFDEFAPEPILDPKPIQRVVVTLGTITFGFRRLVERLITVLPSGCEVLWQVGETDVCALGINARDVVPSGELRDAMRRADVVIAHAGIGSALAAMEAGRCPVLVPRERDRGEHIDDHQQQIAATLDHLGLAIHRSAEAIDLADLVEASKRRTAKRPAPPMLPIAVGAATMATPSPTSRRDSDQSSCR